MVDPRGRRGRRYGVASLLMAALAATLAGARSFVAIGEWVADAPVSALARLGITRSAPSEKAIRKLLQRLDGDALDAAVGAWVRPRASTVGGARVLSFDGKSLRGARDAAGALVHLLSGVCQGTGAVVAQVAVPGKASEVPWLRTLLETLDIAGRVVTADAAHACRETAQLVIDRRAHYILCVEGNRPTLRAMVKSLPWKQIPVLDRVKGKPAHGRVETRVFKATAVDPAAGGINFPGEKQVLRIERTRLTRRRSCGGRRRRPRDWLRRRRSRCSSCRLVRVWLWSSA